MKGYFFHASACICCCTYIWLKTVFMYSRTLISETLNTSFFKYWYIFGQFVVLVHLNLAKITYILKTRFDCISVKHDISTILHTVYLVSSQTWYQYNTTYRISCLIWTSKEKLITNQFSLKKVPNRAYKILLPFNNLSGFKLPVIHRYLSE